MTGMTDSSGLDGQSCHGDAEVRGTDDTEVSARRSGPILTHKEEVHDSMANVAEEVVVRRPDGNLFPARIVPSFYEVAGARAAIDYWKVRQSLDDQELRRASRHGNTDDDR
jgi:hypothetical protein